MIKFNKHNIRDTKSGIKARVHYSVDNRIDGRKCVTLYAKSCLEPLHQVISDGYINDTDIMTDYFDNGRVVLFEDNPLYPAARSRALNN
jgi:hypothetical protein